MSEDVNTLDTKTRSISSIIVGVVLLSLLSFVGLFIYLAVTGHIEISADVSFIGTIAIDTVFYLMLGFVGWLVYIAFQDIYDSDEVKKSVDEGTDKIDEFNK